ncbi:hypothetical protein [Bradyrhizobium sp. RDI18]|uniref:hypothetical protein n=1 Tax=Bradyrhizobium sp. RDI18 TaxID=3367400 RepID=UPI0037155458
MDIDRRKLLAGSACLVLTGLVEPVVAYCRADITERDEAPPWHPLTLSLLSRAQRANTIDGRANMASIEHLVRVTAAIQGWTEPPIIKWLADPAEAIALLNGLGLHALLQMGNAQLWRRAGPAVDLDEDRLNSHLVLGGLIGNIVRASEYDRVLMAPKLLSKARVMAESASVEAIFEVRAIAAQIGWLETCLPIAAAKAVADIELFLSSGGSSSTTSQYIIS